MADAPKRNPPAEDDMHWGIAYLREDIQELRLGQRALHDRVERLAETTTSQIETVNKALSARIDAVNENLSDRVDSMHARMDSRFAVLLTTMVGLIGITIGANVTFLRMYLPSQ